MPRLRTAKAVASRIDLNYFKRWHPLRGGRMLISVVCGLAAVLWWGLYGTGGKTAMYNPGPVSHAHGGVENNCAICHTSDGKGGFFQTVSDSACLTCHNAAIHAPTQKQFVFNPSGSAGPTTAPSGHGAAGEAKPAGEKAEGEGKAAEAPMPGAASATHMASHPRSSDCTHCHVEHRGDMALLGKSDMHCVQCHENLPAHTRDGKPMTEPKVTQFTLANHPPFGRGLTASKEVNQKEPVLVDPTRVKFNHLKHMPQPEINNDCTLCHTTADPNPRSKPPTFARGDTPPWTSDKDRPAKWDVSPDRAYMQPVNYERHCQGCHRIELAGGVIIPHETSAVVRQVAAGIPMDKLQWLAPTPAAAPPAGAPGAPRPGGTPAPTPGGVRPPRLPGRYIGPDPDDEPMRLILQVRPPRPAGAAPTPAAGGGTPTAAAADTRTANDVALDNARRRLNKLNNDPETKQRVTKELDQLREALKAGVPATQPTAANWKVNPSVVEMYVTYFADVSCVMCHDVQGSVPKLAQAAAAPAAPGAAVPPSETGSALLHTLATGIPSSPRRWFEHSRFDHAPHRNITCVDCHGAAMTSSLTSDVLSPNIRWKTADGREHKCTDCHFQSTADNRGATSNCQTCHVYHDRTLDAPPAKVWRLDDVVSWGSGRMGATHTKSTAPPPAPAEGGSGTTTPP